jgi:hypothetical protein
MAVGEAAAAIDVATCCYTPGVRQARRRSARAAGSTEAEALRARRDLVYAQHQVGWALDRPCELDGARWFGSRRPISLPAFPASVEC